MLSSAIASISLVSALACVMGSTLSATGEPLAKSLIVYGERFSFSVREPSGWIADIEGAASMGANIVFAPKESASNSRTPLLRVRVSGKVDENTRADLEHDMQEYRSRFPNVQFADVEVAHSSYAVFSKLFFIPGQWYEYVAYLNPGSSVPRIFSVSLNLQKRAATDAELEAFRRVASSLQFLTENVPKGE